MFDTKYSKSNLDDLAISMLGIALFILMLFVLILGPNNHLGVNHVVFGVVAGASGLSILIEYVREKCGK